MVSGETLLRELERRQAIPRLLEACFAQQVAFIQDPSRRKALFVARRSGKTWAIVVLLLLTALGAPVTKCLYYGQTRASAWDTIYMHMLEPLCRRFRIPVKVNLTLQTLTFENGSVIKIMGDDASESQIDKALGGKYKVVVFDECQSIRRDLRRWINDKLAPALVDLKGTLILGGTAGELMGDHFWYAVTKTDGIREPGWSVHSWTPFDNPYMAKGVRDEWEDMKRLDANYDQLPHFQRQWLCRWVVERENRIYQYSPAKNGIQEYDFTKPGWRVVIGVDFGYRDDTAFVVGAYHPYERGRCFIVDSFKKKDMDAEEAALCLKEWRDKYRPTFMVGDCQNLQLIEYLDRRHGLPIQKADKAGKVGHIAAMNSDFRQGIIQVIEPNNRALIKEWDELVWDEKKRLVGVYVENPTKDNHLADACLYMHHATQAWRTAERPAEEPKGSPMRAEAERQLREQMSGGGPTVYDYLDRAS